MKSKTVFAALLVALFWAIASPVFSQKEADKMPCPTIFPKVKMPKNEAERERLRAINRAIWLPFSAAYEAGDAEKYAALHTEDFIRATIDGTRNKVEDFENSKKQFEQNREKGHRCEIDFTFFERVAGETTASERGIYRYILRTNDGASERYFGRFHVFHRLENGVWKIAVDYDSDEDGAISEADFKAGNGMHVFD